MAYTDGIDVIVVNNPTVYSAFFSLDKDTKRLGLVIRLKGRFSGSKPRIVWGAITYC